MNAKAMPRQHSGSLGIFCAFCVCLVSTAHAQFGGGYKVLLGTIAGGGGASSGGSFSAVGAVGQPVVSNATGGTFEASTGNADANNDPVPVWPTFTAWKQAFFTPAQQNNPSVSGPTADPDGDERANLLEYALYSDPTSASPPQPSVFVDANYLSLIYTRSHAASDITFAIEESTNFATWTAATSATSQVLSDDGFVQTILTQVPRSDAGTGGKLFLRIRVTQP